MTKQQFCKLCQKEFANLKSHQKNIHPNGETKVEKPTMKSLKAEIVSLEDQNKQVENKLTSLRSEMKNRLKTSDQEKDAITQDLRDMTRRFNNLKRKFIDEKSNNNKEQLEKEKNNLLHSKLGKFGNQFFITSHKF